MRKKQAYLVFGLLVQLATAPAFAHVDGGVEAQTIVRHQLSAFARGDADAAFALTSPSMKEAYSNSKYFMASVRAKETPFFHQRRAEFHIFLVDGDVAKQTVLVVDDDSGVWTVVYELVRQSDGSWRINGCIVGKSAALDA